MRLAFATTLPSTASDIAARVAQRALLLRATTSTGTRIRVLPGRGGGYASGQPRHLHPRCRLRLRRPRRKPAVAQTTQTIATASAIGLVARGSATTVSRAPRLGLHRSGFSCSSLRALSLAATLRRTAIHLCDRRRAHRNLHPSLLHHPTFRPFHLRCPLRRTRHLLPHPLLSQ